MYFELVADIEIRDQGKDGFDRWQAIDNKTWSVNCGPTKRKAVNRLLTQLLNRQVARNRELDDV